MISTNVADQNPTFTITETSLYVPVVTLSTQENAKLLPQLKLSFKKTISQKKYLAKPELLAQNVNLNHLIEPSFQEINTLFVLAIEKDDQRISKKRYYIPNVEIKLYNVMIDGKNIFDQQVKNDKVTYENIDKLLLVQERTTSGYMLDYIYFKNYYKMIAVDLSKQQVLRANRKEIQQISFTANLDRTGKTRFYFILEEAKETLFEFLQ